MPGHPIINPFDIFENDAVYQYYCEVYEKVNKSKEDSVTPFFIINKNYKYFSEKEVPYTNNYGKIVGNILILFNTLNINNLLKSYQLEQINYLKKNPEHLKRELFYSLVTSCLLLNESERIYETVNTKKTIGSIAWKYLKNLSLSKGSEELLMDRVNKRRKDMMESIHIATKLLMNVYYINNNVNKSTIDEILSDLVYVPLWDFDELCNYTFPSFMNMSIKDFMKKDFCSFSSYAHYNSTEFPSLVTIIERCDGFLKYRLDELNLIENEATTFYRNKIEEWQTNYPAKINTSNFNLVTDAINKVTKYPQYVSWDYNLAQLNREQRECLIKLFHKKKDFVMPSYYLEIMSNVSELISYWNAFDNNDELEMVL